MFLLDPNCALRLTGGSQQQSASSKWTESDARKILSDSAWAKRAKIRSTIGAPTYIQSVESPGTQPGGPGPGGLGHGVVPPSADQIMSQTAGPQVTPCLGWGVGSMSVPSPTSDECKAAWQSVSAIKSAGLPRGSVIVLWESAEPVREAKSRLAIGEAGSSKGSDAIIISIVSHPVLQQINPAGSMKLMIQNAASLLRNGKDKVQAFDVAFIETNDNLVRFYFPRQGTIRPGDKELIFRFEIQDTLVEAKFNVKEMSYQGHIAL